MIFLSMKNGCRNFVVIAYIIMCVSCVSKKDVAGYYTNTSRDHSGLDELVLFRNGTYTYKYNDHMIVYKSSGTWITDSLQHIYLTSEKQYVNDFNVIESEVLSESITIKVIDREAQDILPYAAIVLYSKGEKRGVVTDLNGVAKFYNQDKIDSMSVRFLGFHNVSYTIKNQRSNNFRVEMESMIPEYLYLKNEKLIKKNKKLLWPNLPGNYRVLKKR